MFWEGNYNSVGNHDVTALRERLDGLGPDIWLSNTSRQANPLNHRHTQTQSLLMIYDDDLERLHDPPTLHPAWEQLKDVVQPVLDKIRAHFGGHGYFLRAFTPKLAPGGIIYGHVDRAMSLINAHRVHMPIVTNDRVSFRVGGETKVPKVGEIFEINNQRSHAARNASEDARVHLLVDWVETDASGAPRKKPRLDIVGTPDRFDQTCAQVKTLVERLQLQGLDRDRVHSTLDAMAEQWRRIFSEHADHVRARSQYLAVIEQVMGDVFEPIRTMKGEHWESLEADAFGRLFVTFHILTKGLYES
jgi:hypothetical protein